MKASSELVTGVEATSSELELLQTQYDTLLKVSEEADQAANKTIRASSLEAGLWRTGALSFGAGLAGALLAPSKTVGAGYGIGLGLVIGAIWGIFEGWLPFRF